MVACIVVAGSRRVVGVAVCCVDVVCVLVSPGFVVGSAGGVTCGLSVRHCPGKQSVPLVVVATVCAAVDVTFESACSFGFGFAIVITTGHGIVGAGGWFIGGHAPVSHGSVSISSPASPKFKILKVF